jgi:transposase-like protein
MAKMKDLVLDVVDMFEDGVPSDTIARTLNIDHSIVLEVIEDYFPMDYLPMGMQDE